jgi:MoxR-like ATPase
VQAEVAKVVIGQDAVVETLLGAILVGGHVLLEGVPGVAKTLMAQAFSRTLALGFRRVQFTPDMLPSDLTGTMILRTGELEFSPGPVFTQVLLGDEINRTPPKTQAALLEAMQEGTVTVDGTTRPLPRPFLVLATQNPLEYEGTYPLPEAQLDRFHVRATVGYPSAEDELRLLALAHHGVAPTTLDDVRPVVSARSLAAAAKAVDETRVTGDVARYVVGIVRSTREAPGIQTGASPRAGVHLLAAAKAAARLSGRDFATPDDVEAVAGRVLAHRLVLTPESELERVPAEDLLAAAVSRVAVPR